MLEISIFHKDSWNTLLHQFINLQIHLGRTVAHERWKLISSRQILRFFWLTDSYCTVVWVDNTYVVNLSSYLPCLLFLFSWIPSFSWPSLTWSSSYCPIFWSRPPIIPVALLSTLAAQDVHVSLLTIAVEVLTLGFHCITKDLGTPIGSLENLVSVRFSWMKRLFKRIWILGTRIN